MYSIFIAITLFAMTTVIYLVFKDIIKPDRLSIIIDLFKYALVSVAIATTTLIISDLFREREQDVKELEYFDKYVEVVMKADGVRERYQLAKYFSIVAPSGEMKSSWIKYHKAIEPELNEYYKLKVLEGKLSETKNPTLTQIKRKVQVAKRIKEKESPLIGFPKISIRVIRETKLAVGTSWTIICIDDKNAPIAKAVVNKNDVFIGTTNAAGMITIEIPEGEQPVISVNKLGYSTFYTIYGL